MKSAVHIRRRKRREAWKPHHITSYHIISDHTTPYLASKSKARSIVVPRDEPQPEPEPQPAAAAVGTHDAAVRHARRAVVELVDVSNPRGEEHAGGQAHAVAARVGGPALAVAVAVAVGGRGGGVGVGVRVGLEWPAGDELAAAEEESQGHGGGEGGRGEAGRGGGGRGDGGGGHAVYLCAAGVSWAACVDSREGAGAW